MKIIVKSFASLRDIMDKEVKLELPAGTTILAMLENLSGNYPGLHEELFEPDGTLKLYVNILKNGRNVYFLDNLSTVIDDGDVITIFPPAAGG
jgi:molybdopterin synthase sulfur carrier subunit